MIEVSTDPAELSWALALPLRGRDEIFAAVSLASVLFAVFATALVAARNRAPGLPRVRSSLVEVGRGEEKTERRRARSSVCRHGGQRTPRGRGLGA